jgi:hypothetical protein
MLLAALESLLLMYQQEIICTRKSEQTIIYLGLCSDMGLLLTDEWHVSM